VDADEVLGAGTCLGEGADRQGGSVRCKDQVFVRIGKRLPGHLGLECQVFEDRLDDEVAAPQVGRICGRLNALQGDLCLFGGNASLLDAARELLSAPGLGLLGLVATQVLQDHADAARGSRPGDTRAHHARPEYTKFHRHPRGLSSRSATVRLDVVEVEEEGGDHVLCDLGGGQAGEPARLDPQCSIKIKRCALGCNREDRLLGREVATGFIEQHGRGDAKHCCNRSR